MEVLYYVIIMCISIICCLRHQPQHRKQVMNSFILRDQVLMQDHMLDHELDQVLVLVAVYADSVVIILCISNCTFCTIAMISSSLVLACTRRLKSFILPHITVEPPIIDSLRYRLPLYNGRDKPRAPNWFCHRNNPLRDGQPPVSKQRTEQVPPKDR